MSKKKTIGQHSTDLMVKHRFDPMTNAIDVQRASEKEYLDNLNWAIEHAQKNIDCSNIPKHEYCKTRDPIKGDFYITVIVKKEPALANLFRNYFITATCCPTPTYDQTVWIFNSLKQRIELIWTIPDKESCMMYKENKHIIDKEEHQLLQYVLDFYDGVLDKMARKLNKEEKSGLILFRKDSNSELSL